MIDIENEIFTLVATALRTPYPNINVQGVITYSPSVFPTVCIEEIDNYSDTATRTNGSNENFTNLTYEVTIYSNKVPGGKQECKDILSVVDSTLQTKGFTRLSKTFLQNISNESRMVARYSAKVGSDNYIYWR